MAKKTKIMEDLEEVRKRTLLDIERLKEELQAEIEPASATDDDSADVAGDIYERGKIISLIKSMETKLRSVERAIVLASKGTYGTCEVCGQPIPEERLQIMPETTVCVRCASRLEEGARRRQILVTDEAEDDYSDDDDDDFDDDGGDSDDGF
jgi:RNA polymerase-binding transcription factor DksA